MNDWLYFYSAWTSFLRTADPLIGIPLCAVGAALAISGWRAWRVVSILSLALVGGALGQLFAGAGGFDPLRSGGGAVLFALAGIVLVDHAATLLGGVIGACAAAVALETFGIVGHARWAGCFLAIIGATAWAFANRRRVAVLLTSVEGGVLLASGMSILLPEIPLVYGYFRTLTINSPFMVVFFVLVPTVVGVMLQQADANRSSSAAARG